MAEPAASRQRPDPDALVAEVVTQGVPADLVLEHLRSYGFVVVDAVGTGEDTPLDQALRQFLLNTRPPSGAFGQSMENTLAVHAVVELRAAAARHLKALDSGSSGGAA